MPTINVPDISGVVTFLSGKKTYIAVAIGMAAVALNHFGLLPPQYAISNDPKNWLNDEFTLLVTAFMRSGIAKAGESAKQPPKEPAAPLTSRTVGL